jgi:hypothetical protein
MKYPLNKWALKRLGIIPVFFLSLFPGCFAQLYNTDAASIALAGCYASGPAGSSGIYNEASLGFTGPITYHVSHVRPFVIKELGISSVGVQFPLFPGNMRAEIQHYGIPGFQELNSSLGYGLKLSENIFAGVGFRYYNTFSQGEWSYLRTLGLSGGVIVKAGESTRVGVHIINPATINNYPEYGAIFPSIITLGIRREIYASSNLLGEIMYHSELGLVSKIAAEYRCSDKVFLRAGYHSRPVTLSFGTGLILPPIKLDMAFAYSARCGVMPALSITYIRGK